MHNRLYRADCKIVADQLKEEGIQADVIYLDPPFNSNRTYSMLFNHRGITAQQKAYHDMWDFTDRTRQLVLDFSDELKAWDLPDSFKDFMRAWLSILEQGTSNDKKLLNYLMYMTQRLIRFKKLLNPTGSIYFHCDPTASHYIKVIMDGVFGRSNFRNEIVWKRTAAHSDSKTLGSVHDVILHYTATDEFTWNHQYQPHAQSYIDSHYRRRNAKGRRYRTDNVTAGGLTGGGYEYEWNGVTKVWRYPEPRMQELHDAGRLHYTRSGTPEYIRYLDESKGVPLQSVWADIAPINSQAKERMGYPTQKPLALLERIIKVSTNKGEVVLDPYCGCGTGIEAAHIHKRKWIGIDISGNAVDEMKDRMAKHGLYEGNGYELLEGSPDTMAEYKRLNPFEKQDWLIRRLGGLPNPKKSGDEGVDGDLTFHLGIDNKGNDLWGKLVFSVKTGKQKTPAHIRELRGTMSAEKAKMGVLILDVDPTSKMEEAAQKGGQFQYQLKENVPPENYEKIQIITAYEIIEGGQISCPPTMTKVKNFRKSQVEMKV